MPRLWDISPPIAPETPAFPGDTAYQQRWTLQIGPGWLRYCHDHVLDDMLRGFGLDVHVELAPFEPEGGAYVAASHAHTHPHSHV